MPSIIQIGTIAYKDTQTNKYANTKPLYITKTKALEDTKKEFFKNACDMFIFDLLEFAKNGIN